jgi:glycosyltransferase involved in cell wall biosynthesis
MTVKDFDISIVICTHHRSDLFAGAVKSLVRQTATPDSYEVIVVDNDLHPNPLVQEVVSCANSQIHIRYLHEARLGLSHARNQGGRYARSEYIGYLDDDALANPKHIEILTQICKKYKPDICGGPFYPFYLEDKPRWFKDIYGSGFFYGNRPRYLRHREYLGGGNIAFRRNVLDGVGWFDIHLGMKGEKISYGEETDVMINAWRANPNLKVYYDPALYVHHLVPSSKMSVENMLKIEFMKGKSHAYFWIPTNRHDFFRILSPCILIFSLFYLGFNVFRGVISFNREKYPFWQNFAFEVLNTEAERLGRHIQLISDSFAKLLRKA